MESELKLPLIEQGRRGFDDDRSRSDAGKSKRSHQTFGSVKKQRKQIDQDAQLLANRIALLKQEELRTLKKIDETKKKAHEIFLLKQKNEERMLKKKERIEAKPTPIANTEVRKKRQMERENIFLALQNQKRQESLEVRKVSEMNERKKKEIEQKMAGDAFKKSYMIKNELAEASERIRLFKEKKALLFQQEQERRIREEEQRIAQKEAQVLNMEKLEMELISKLQHTQQLQKKAYEELEGALMLSPVEYEQRYLKENNDEVIGGGNANGEAETKISEGEPVRS